MGASTAERWASVNALMDGVVDYAGLFPPAALPMRDALRSYATALAGPDAWLLGRFVVPASRLPELLQHVDVFERPTLPLSVIVADGADDEMARIREWRARNGQVRVECIECKPRNLESIDWLAKAGGGLEIYVELDPSADLAPWFAKLAAAGLRAKLRTGGTQATAFPSPASVIGFIAAAIDAGVPFKATAGLHHAIRGTYRLTYEPDAPTAVMHGYLNVLLAAAALRAGRSRESAERVMREDDPSSLVIGADSIRWTGLELPVAQLRDVRADGIMGFGSCSIAEPAGEIRALVARPVEATE